MMSHPTTMAQMPPGSKALVTKIDVKGLMRRRLLDLGLVPGTRVEMIRRSPLGDPTAYQVRGAVIALRRELAEQVSVGEAFFIPH